jgi:4-coumarate--CoA ligase
MTIFESLFPPIDIPDLSITELVFRNLTARPEGEVVLVDGPTRREVTAGALVTAITALAGGLSKRGHGAGTTVAILAPNIPEYAIVYHAVSWAGGTLTTINPTYTPEEVRHQLRDARASLLITVPPFLETARAAVEGTEVRDIAVIGEASFTDLMGPPLAAQVPVDVAGHVHVLPYSSGTTGLPKGVMLSHRNMVANVLQCQALRPVATGEWTVGFLPFFHIYGMEVLLNLYLANGGRIVTMPRFDLELFLKLCQDYRTPQAFIVPPVALALAKHPMVDQFDLSALTRVLSGAAPLGAELAGALTARLGIPCEQGYGMTEMSPVSHLTPRDRGRNGAAGLTVPGAECRIVDPGTGRDMGAGEEGELWVRGPQVMLGYLNNDKATAATMEGEWLKTGDIGHFDADGYLFITDRLKELIKVKGFQVAPAEVEACLQAHSKVADVAVIGRKDDEAGEVPVAYVVPKDMTPTLDELQAHVAAHLATYKQIRAVEVVDAIPKSASGKILRRVLRERDNA